MGSFHHPRMEKPAMSGPVLQFSDNLHARKYRGEGESFREFANRVASALKDNDDHYHRFRDILLTQRFLPAGRVQSAIGSTKNITPYNCFVSGTIEDSFVDGAGSIMSRAHEAATTMRMGGGIGYDFSTLRPRGDMIRKLRSRSTGPISFMEIYNAIGLCTSSTDHRRGAQMGVLRVDHPDIEEFIRAKQNRTRLTGFNISVAITDEFMECVSTGRAFPLRFQGQVYREIDPLALWDSIMRSTWDWAEPGVLFIDQINRMNNLRYCETIAATNPCGEQPLPPFGACLLGSINLVKYVTPSFGFDYDQLCADIPDVIRAMDNVVDRAIFPLFEQEKEAKGKRRMGIGVTGLANAIQAQGHRDTAYGAPRFLEIERRILNTVRDVCYDASIQLAQEKGAFPMYRAEQYLDGNFIKTLPEDIRERMKKHGIRNSHLTSIAPTGTISLTADNVSSGIEPVFSLSTKRKMKTFDGEEEVVVEDYAYRTWGDEGKTADKVSVEEHLAVLVAAQQRVDSAVSKTCNIPGDTSWEDFKQVYMDAWEGGAKGCTTFRMEGKRGAILEAAPVTEGAACRILEDGTRTCE